MGPSRVSVSCVKVSNIVITFIFQFTYRFSILSNEHEENFQNLCSGSERCRCRAWIRADAIRRFEETGNAGVDVGVVDAGVEAVMFGNRCGRSGRSGPRSCFRLYGLY